jgi:hypothetical protein
MAGLLAFPLGARGSEETCKEIRLKPLHCVRGIVFNLAGEFVAGATVTIIMDGTPLTSLKTSGNGVRLVKR